MLRATPVCRWILSKRRSPTNASRRTRTVWRSPISSSARATEQLPRSQSARLMCVGYTSGLHSATHSCRVSSEVLPTGGTMTRSRTITWNDPVESAAYGQGLTGLEFLHRQTSGLIPAAPVADLIGLRGTYVMPGRVTFEYEPREEHYSSLGAVHGGIVTAVLDSAMCAAMQSVLDAEVGLATTDLRTTFVRPVTLSTDAFRVE